MSKIALLTFWPLSSILTQTFLQSYLMPHTKGFLPMQSFTRHSLAQWGGIGAITSATAFLFTLIYVFVILAGAGLTEEMLDTPALLLPWVAEHTMGYAGIYWIFLLSVLALLPAPLAHYALIKNEQPTLATIGVVAGLIGVTIGMIGPLVNLAGTAILARSYVAQTTTEPGGLLILSEMVGELGLLLRLTSDLFLGIWLGLSGLAVVGRHTNGRWFGVYSILVALLIVVVVIGKALTAFDLEPMLGLILAIAYGWLGWLLLTQHRMDRNAETK
jgi:hypothetical protein